MDDNTQTNDDFQEPENEDNIPVSTPPLPEDNDPPAAPATDDPTSPQIPLDHPSTDTGMDEHEKYDEGVAGATEVEPPSTGADTEDEAL